LRSIAWWDQARVQAACVVVVGAGALGNEVLKNLALLGVGTILIVDMDTVEAANLTRSLLFRAGDAGRPKAMAAAAGVRALNPEVRAIPFHGDITRDVGLGVFRRADVVIGCLDNRAARLAVNSACWQVGRPWVDGALNIVDGMVRAFTPDEGACYECTLTDADYALLNLRYSCPPGFRIVAGREPTTPMAAAVIGAMQVHEAVKLIHGLPVHSGRTSYYSADRPRITPVQHRRRESCTAHQRYEPIDELPYGVVDLTLGQLFAAADERIGAPAVLYLPRPIVLTLRCLDCGQHEQVLRPYDEVVPDKVPCPRCGALRNVDVTGTLMNDPALSAIPVSGLGIPRLDILAFRSMEGWHYLELSADAAAVFASGEEDTLC
jgi:adenylyltransferase/sulfurtransferase